MASVFDAIWPHLIQQESGGNPFALSPKGAFGLAQLMPGTARDPGFGVKPFNPSIPGDNERMGKDYFKAMLSRYGSDPLRALVAYNWGPGNADKWNGDISRLPGETRNYVKKILGDAQPMMLGPLENKEMARGYRGQGAPGMPLMNQPAAEMDRSLLGSIFNKRGGGILGGGGGLLGGGGGDLGDMLLSLGAGIASGGGWGQGIGRGLALAQQSRQNNRENQLAEMMLGARLAEMSKPDLTEKEKLYKRAKDEGFKGTLVDFLSMNEGGKEPPSYRTKPDGTQEFVPGGKADPAVIAREADARGRSGDVPLAAKNEAIKADQAYKALVQSLDDYESTVKRTGNTLLPGADSDEVESKRTNIQLQMKELYNLGVLNGPDLALMEKMLFDPSASLYPFSGSFGFATDPSGRVKASVDRAKEMIRQQRNAKTQTIGMPDIPAAGGANMDSAIDAELKRRGL